MKSKSVSLSWEQPFSYSPQKKEEISLIDPSQLLRPEPVFNDKPLEAFRDYTVDDNDPVRARVRKTYYDMHTNVTVELVKRELSLFF